MKSGWSLHALVLEGREGRRIEMFFVFSSEHGSKC